MHGGVREGVSLEQAKLRFLVNTQGKGPEAFGYPCPGSGGIWEAPRPQMETETM